MTRDEQQITDELHETRQELGDTVEALAHKADVPARVRGRAAQVPPKRWAAMAGGLLGVIALLAVARTVRSR